MAFLLSEYVKLLERFRLRGYSLGPVRRFFEGAVAPFVFLRHDVDRLPCRALAMAEAEKAVGVSSTYYFRCNSKAEFPSAYVKGVAALGHEVGFHYETMALSKGDFSKAMQLFELQLAALRNIVDVKTISAHGSPVSRFSNVFYAKDFDLKRFGLLGNCSVDFDSSPVLYVTDTGGIYGSPNNLRDYTCGKNLRRPTAPTVLAQMLDPVEEPLILLNSHPERWPNGWFGLLQSKSLDWTINFCKKAYRIWRSCP